jgi:hypothetical protein
MSCRREGCTGVSMNQSVEFNRRCAGELSEVGKWHTAEAMNGDSPQDTSSSPSPEKLDEVPCGESPLEKSIADPEE